jgi:PPOX class probable F420-dependent enzyme
MARTIATETRVDRAGLEEFIRPRHHGVLSTRRRDGTPQMSPVTMGLGPDGAILVSSYPERAKVHNLRRDQLATVCVLSDEFGGPWVQVSGPAAVVDLPEALEGLVTYFRSISGEHPDWVEYRSGAGRTARWYFLPGDCPRPPGAATDLVRMSSEGKWAGRHEPVRIGARGGARGLVLGAPRAGVGEARSFDGRAGSPDRR